MRLVLDDAAVFPPGDLPLADAVVAHRLHRAAGYAGLVGPLVVTVPDLARLAGAGPLEVAVVAANADAAAAAMHQAPEGVRIAALEISGTTVAALQSVIGEPAGVTVYVELPRDGHGGERRAALVEALAGSPYRAKLRTGGVRADLYPDELELAETVVALSEAGVPFKATAGLHHALRNTDPDTGFEQHGFLNLLAATDAAVHGAGVDDLAAVLAQRDARSLAIPAGETLLRSIGTCSIADPVAELADLGLLAGVR